MDNKQIIGFANKYYTLWDYSTEKNYVTNSSGNSQVSSVYHKFQYLKNISFDLDKVKSLYPNVEIDDSLRGMSSSFIRTEKINVPENVIPFGKYYGSIIDDILKSDFKYCLWLVDNSNHECVGYIKNNPIYISYIESLLSADREILNNSNLLKVGDVVDVEFLTNGYNSNEDYTECFTAGRYGDIRLSIRCNGVRRVDGMYPYLMPMVDGKAQRTKNKTIKVTISENSRTYISDGEVVQDIAIL